MRATLLGQKHCIAFWGPHPSRPYRAVVLRALGVARDTSRSSHAQWPATRGHILDPSRLVCTNANSARHARAGAGSSGSDMLHCHSSCASASHGRLDVPEYRPTKQTSCPSAGSGSETRPQTSQTLGSGAPLRGQTARIWKSRTGPCLFGPLRGKDAEQPHPACAVLEYGMCRRSHQQLSTRRQTHRVCSAVQLRIAVGCNCDFLLEIPHRLQCAWNWS